MKHRLLTTDDLIKNTASGKSLCLPDASNEKLQKLSAVGETEDFKVFIIGNNLFNPTVISAKANEESKTSNYGSIDSTEYNGEIKLTSPKYTYNPEDKNDYATHYKNGLFYIWLDEAFLPISEKGETYTFIADVVIDERHNNSVSGEPAPNTIALTGTGGGLSSSKIIITGTTEDGKEKGKVIGTGVNKYKVVSGVIDYSQKNKIEVRTVGKSMTFTKIMLLHGDYTSNISEYEDYKEQVITDVNNIQDVHTYYPITRIITDNDNIELSVEYIADTKNYIDSKSTQTSALILEVK